MEEKDKNRVTVTILGEEYTLKGSSSVEEMQQVGFYVDHLMRKLGEKNIQMSKHRVAVLAALNLADELMRLKKETETKPPAEKSTERGESDELA